MQRGVAGLLGALAGMTVLVAVADDQTAASRVLSGQIHVAPTVPAKKPDHHTGLLGSKALQDYVTDFLETYPAGAKVAGDVDFGERSFPLLPGDWVVLSADGKVTKTTYQGGGGEKETGALGTVILGQLQGNAVSKMMYISVPLYGYKDRTRWFDVSPICKMMKKEWVYNFGADSAIEDKQRCWSTEYDKFTVDEKSAIATVKAVEFMSKNGLTVPQLLVYSRAVLATYADRVFFSVSYNGDQPAFKTTSDMKWRYFEIGDDQKKLVEAVTQDASGIRKLVMQQWGLN